MRVLGEPLHAALQSRARRRNGRTIEETSQGTTPHTSPTHRTASPRDTRARKGWTQAVGPREHPPMMLNVIANTFRVPLVLGPDGKRNALAVRLLQHCGIEDTNTNRASAMSVIGQIAQLGENGMLDPLIGGYERGERAGILRRIPADIFRQHPYRFRVGHRLPAVTLG